MQLDDKKLRRKMISQESKQMALLIITIIIVIILSPALFILGATVEALHKSHRRDNGKRKRFFSRNSILNTSNITLDKHKEK